MSETKQTELLKTAKFEKSLQQLQDLVNKLESGELSLEQSVSTFEKGMELAKNCSDALTAAEQKVQILLEKNGVVTKQDFHFDEHEFPAAD